jgi:hypothetical protein
MNTLVIHPKDHTTDFLSAIYSDKPDWRILDFNCSKAFLKQQIFNHDRIIIMGHGIPFGLLGHSKLFVNPEFAYLLRDTAKRYIFIWCNADMFVSRYKLSPQFFTGMFISEVGEAKIYGIEANQEQINYSNNLFADVVRKSINLDNFYNEVKNDYANYINENPVIVFNNERLYGINY